MAKHVPDSNALDDFNFAFEQLEKEDLSGPDRHRFGTLLNRAYAKMNEHQQRLVRSKYEEWGKRLHGE